MKRSTFALMLATLLAVLTGGCGEPAGEDLSKVQAQPNADLEKGRAAQTLDQWAAANPNNGAPGNGEGGGK
ncbi:MAG: hypothetical protein ACO1SV_25010 [Fimbriimonas sp.]